MNFAKCLTGQTPDCSPGSKLSFEKTQKSTFTRGFCSSTHSPQIICNTLLSFIAFAWCVPPVANWVAKVLSKNVASPTLYTNQCRTRNRFISRSRDRSPKLWGTGLLQKKKALSSDKPVYGFFQLHVSLPLLTSMSYPARHKLGNGNLYVPYSHTWSLPIKVASCTSSCEVRGIVTGYLDFWKFVNLNWSVWLPAPTSPPLSPANTSS